MDLQNVSSKTPLNLIPLISRSSLSQTEQDILLSAQNGVCYENGQVMDTLFMKFDITQPKELPPASDCGISSIYSSFVNFVSLGCEQECVCDFNGFCSTVETCSGELSFEVSLN